MVLPVIALGACARSRGFDRGAMKARTSTAETTDQEIQKVLAIKPRLPQKYRLAIYFVPPTASSRYAQTWRWTAEGKNEILKIAKPLADKGVTLDVFSLSRW